MPKSKLIKVLAVLNELGTTGTARILVDYKSHFPNDFMDRKLIAQSLDYQFQRQRVTKKYGRRNKRFWGLHPQIYTITQSGKNFLKNEDVL